MNTKSLFPRQRGAALIVSLVILVIVSIIGVSAIQLTLVQERMAGNQHDRNTAFQATEAALRAGERAIRTNNFIERNTPLTTIASNNWAGWTTDAVSVALNNANLSANPAYVVSTPVRQRVNLDNSNPIFVEIFPVTARGSGETARVANQPSTTVILRSNFLL